MSQSGYTPIQLYYSSTSTNVPVAGNLANGELALNIADGKLFYKDNLGSVQLLASKASTATSFSAGTTGLTPNTATSGAVTLAGTLNIANGGTGSTSAASALIALGERTSATGSTPLPSGTTAQRDVSPVEGYFRYNSTTKLVEAYNGSTWAEIGFRNYVVLPTGTSTTINCDTTYVAYQQNTSASGTHTINAPTGTPNDGQQIMLKLKTTNPQLLSFNPIFQASDDIAFPVSSSTNKFDYMGFIYSAEDNKWHFLAKNFGF